MATGSPAERVSGRHTIPFRRTLFYVLAGLVALVVGSVSAVVEVQGRLALTARAKTALERAVGHAELEMDAMLKPVSHQLRLSRDWVLSGVVGAAESTALNRLFIPALNNLAQLVSLRVALVSGEEWLLQREAGGWLSRNVREEQGGRRAVWSHWDVRGTTMLRQERGELAYDPREEPWFRGAIERYRERSDGNRDGAPSLYWSAPELLRRTNTVGLTASTAVRDDDDLVVVICFEVDARGVQALGGSPIYSGGGRIAVLDPDGMPLAASNAAAADTPAVATAFAQWRSEGADPRSALRVAEGLDVRWYRFQPYVLAPDRRLWIAAEAHQAVLLRPSRLLEAAILTVGGAGLLMAVLLALFMCPSYTRTIHAVIGRALRADVLELGLGYWPRSRLREIDALTQALDTAFAAFGDRLVENAGAPLPGLDLPDAKPWDSGVAGARASVAEEAPVIAEPADATRAAAAGGEPPQAYVQAMRSTRRRLRQLRADLEGMRQQWCERDAAWQALQQRLSAQGQALLALSGHDGFLHGRLEDALGVFTQRIAEAAGVQWISVWQADAGLSRLTCVRRRDSGGAGWGEGEVWTRTDHPLFLLALASDGPVAVPDLARDPRTASLCPVFPEPMGVNALMAVPVRVAGQVVGMLSFEHTGGERHWQADEKTFVLMLAELLTRRFQGEMLPA